MTPIQQLMLGVGAKKKTYLDDVFHTRLFTTTTINADYKVTNNIDNSGEGGLVWYKDRIGTSYHMLFDTARGSDKYIYSNATSGQNTSTQLKSFDSDGYTFKTGTNMVNPNRNAAVWNFRKAPGFFDCVEFSGNGTAYRAIAHNLKCVPGLLMVKRTDTTGDWQVLHRKHYGTTSKYSSLKLNSTAAAYDSWSEFNQTNPTATHFTVSNDPSVNATGGTYICYLFAGGESNASEARSVDFDGTGDKLSLSSHADLQIGSSTYTMEFWVYKNVDTPDDYDVWAAKGSNNNNTREFAIESFTDQRLAWWYSTNGSSWSDFTVANNIPTGQWTHICAQKDSNGYFSFFVNGTRTYYSTTGGATLNTDSDPFCIGGFADASTSLESNVKISNFRFVKGTALYSSSFKPSTEPLTNVTNTKLLCCNDSSITGSTVTPSTISSVGSPTASTDSPFDDPSGFVFGENEDQNVIKCGSYTTDSNEDATINLGWEPQWVLAKRTDSSTGGDWMIVDSIRGLPNAQDIQANTGDCEVLAPNLTSAENNTHRLGLTSTGFYADQFGSNRSFIYMAIRRSDGYVGKPPELGSDVFAMDTGAGSSTIPNFDSGFPVDFTFARAVDSTANWDTGARLIQGKYINTNSSGAEGNASNMIFDSNVGWNSYSSWGSGAQSWMWKRHAGFDVVTWTGDGIQGRQIPHSLSKSPEMVWVKTRSQSSQNWMVGHKGLNGGTNPWEKYINLNISGSENDYPVWNDQAPTSTHFAVSSIAQTNASSETYIAMLFASTDVSKVGYYTGTGSATTITTGFQPRFLLIKNVSSAVGWYLLDTTRGWGSGNDEYLTLNDAVAQDEFDFGAPTSTGFTLASGDGGYNGSNQKYIYYAHA